MSKDSRYKLFPTWGAIQLSKNKSFEYQFEFGKFNDSYFEFSIRWTSKQDHAGFDFMFSIYKLVFIHLNFYDHRHWDYEKHDWVDYSKSED